MDRLFVCRPRKVLLSNRPTARLLTKCDLPYAMLATLKTSSSLDQANNLIRGLLQCLDERDIVAFQQNLTCLDISMLKYGDLGAGAKIPRSLRFSSSVFVACFTSTASSITRFMNSSKPWRSIESASLPRLTMQRMYPYFSFYPYGQLLIKPNRNG